MVNVFTVENGKISGYDVYADTAAFVAGLQQ
jgi:ketosteroid isomerase-like protein